MLNANATGAPKKDMSSLDKLTKKQKRIVDLVKQGLRNQDVADLMGVNEKTIKDHLTRIYKVLSVDGRPQLLLMEVEKRSEQNRIKKIARIARGV